MSIHSVDRSSEYLFIHSNQKKSIIPKRSQNIADSRSIHLDGRLVIVAYARIVTRHAMLKKVSVFENT